MIRRPPRSTRTDTLFPYTTLFRSIVTVNLAGELDGLATLARRIAADHRATRDLGPDSLRTALVELLVELPAYRSYADAQGCGAADADMLAGAAERAARHPFIEDRRPVDFLSSEERRLGQVGGDTGRFRWSSYL